MDLLLVRAGRTSWEDERRLQGKLDVPLSPGGIHEVREQVRSARFDPKEICSSLTLCALQTARIIADELKRPLRKVEGLEEVNLGMWEGLLLGDLEYRHRKTFAAWRASALAVVPPAGEWLGDAFERLVDTLEALFAHYGKGETVAVVVPPMAYRLLQCHLKDVGPERFWEQKSEGFRWVKAEI